MLRCSLILSNGNLITTDKNDVYYININQNKLISHFNLPSAPTSIIAVKDEQVAFGFATGLIEIFDLATSKCVKSFLTVPSQNNLLVLSYN